MFSAEDPEGSLGWGMDNVLNAVLFAEDLLDYVLAELGYKWSCKNSAKSLPPGSASKRFAPLFGEAIIEIMSWNIESIANFYKDLTHLGVMDARGYRREICISATLHFRHGYHPEKYVTFCALLVGISAFYFADGKTQMVEVSAQMLAYIMNYYIYHYCVKPSNDWFGLCLTSQDMRRSLHDGGIEFVTPLTSRTL